MPIVGTIELHGVYGAGALIGESTSEQEPGARARGQVPAFWLALLAAPLASSLSGLALILPDMARGLGTSVETVSWLVTAVGWAIAVGAPLMADLLRRRGTRTMLVTSTSLVLVGMVCVLASASLPLLLVGRAVQAVGGAGLVTIAMSLAGTAKRMGLITAGFGVCGAVGPLAGAVITDALSWHIALILPVVSLLAVPVVVRFTTAGPVAATTSRFDVVGAGLLVALVAGLVFVPRFPVLAVVGVLVMAGLLAAHLRVRPDGFVPVALLRTPVFLLSSGLALALSTSYFTLLYVVPRLVRIATGWGSGQVGVWQMIALLVGSALSWVLTALSARMSRLTVLIVLICLGALVPLIVAVVPWAPVLLAALAIAVFTASAGQATLAVFATNSVSNQRRPTAIGMFNLCYQLGGAFGPAIATLLVLR
ncbi:MAG: MFS transporter [Kutzneria sp.]|nr:MFS transporter [Kutzneria sp.]MBV9844206.1 MFS transporter [Kutzneria sp.]